MKGQKSALTVGKRIGLGFGLVLVVLGIVAGWSIFGFNYIVGHLGETVECNVLRGEIAQEEIEHLNWAFQVEALLTDERVIQLDVQTDPHKCTFGQWYYGDGRKAAEHLLPEVRQDLAAIEDPHRRLHESAIEIGEHFRQADPELPGILAAREVDDIKWAAGIRDCFLTNQEKLTVQTDATQCALGKWLGSDQAKAAYRNGSAEFKAAWDEMTATHKKLHDSAVQIRDNYAQIHEGLKELLLARLIDHQNWTQNVAQAIIEGRSELGVQTDDTKCAYGKFLASEEYANYTKSFPVLKEILESSKTPHHELHASAIAIGAALAKGPEGKAEAERVFKEGSVPALAKIADTFHGALAAEDKLIQSRQTAEKYFNDTTMPLLHDTMASLEHLEEASQLQLVGMHKAHEVFATKTQPALAEVQKLLEHIGEVARDAAGTQNTLIQSNAERTRMAVGVVSAIAIIVGILLAFFIARSIVKVLTRIVNGLNDGADQVNDAAGQVSSASQQLAEGASDQASSLEETSSALEQMAAMTRTNAENAKEANELATQARQAANDGDQTMHKLNDAMTGINTSSDKISKIIKVIEEIAFQTNLLALNAAVEAARAGEHGKGFAVVAEEVRNLAQRAAGAARETTDLIEDSVNRAREGTGVAGEVAKALSAIVGDVTKVTDLVDGITRASEEQAQGVDQVNIAVSQMDKVTQQNASGAEESASASEELAAQAQTVKSIVGDLVALVGGSAESSRQTYASRGTATYKSGQHKTEVAHLNKNKPQKTAPAGTGYGEHTDESYKEPASSGDGKLGDF